MDRCARLEENTVYRGVIGWQSFEPWLSRIENLAPETI
jgi:hypothetical protein